MSFDFGKYFDDPKNVLVLDGGFSTQLTNHVSERFDGNPLWCSICLHKDPEAVKKTHLDYLRGVEGPGADVITTDTYQASVEGFKEHLKIDEERAIDLMESAVRLAREARDVYLKENGPDARKPLIAGSVGPYGASLNNGSEYTGSYVNHVGLERMLEWHEPRIRALVEAGVDLLAVETMPAAIEAQLLVRHIRDAFPDTKAWVSFSCRDGHRTNFGENFREAATNCYRLSPEQIIAVGVNCTSPKYVRPLIDGIDDGDRPIPFVVYPNSGENYHPRRGWIDRDKCRPLETFVSTWLDSGARIVGSCCRTYAENTNSIRSEVERWKKI